MKQSSQKNASTTRDFFDDAASKVRDSGLRLTPQRSAILELFDCRSAHMTPQSIFDALEDEVSSLSLATVYNSLEVFEEVGVVDKICSEDGQTYFDPNTEPHQHAVCQKCGSIFDIEVPSGKLDELLEAMQPPESTGTEFDVNSVDVWLQGLCADCQEPREEAETSWPK